MTFPEWSEICDLALKGRGDDSELLRPRLGHRVESNRSSHHEATARRRDPRLSQLGYSKGLLTGQYAEFADLAIASQKRNRDSYWTQLKRSTSQQMTNLRVRQPTDESTPPTQNARESSVAADAQSFELDADAKTDFSFAERMLHAVSEHHANPMTMVSDIARLSRRPNRLPPYEYFLYQLWDEQRFDAAAKQSFLGSDGWVRINQKMKNRWPDLAEDKLAISALLQAHDLPTPHTQAIYHRIRHFPGAQQLLSQDDVMTFLREDAAYPLFGKPVGSQLSLGVAAINGYDKSTDELQMADGTAVSVEHFVNQITATEHNAKDRRLLQLGAGYLFQTQLRPHPELARIVGVRTGTVRMICVADDQGVELIRASWKIPGGDNVADNLWRSGNLLAGIEPDTGELMHVVKPGPLTYEFVTEHTDSGFSFDGFQFPEWNAMLEVVMNAAKATPDCIFQGWDVALCADGPVVLELQAGGGNPVLAQLGYSTGLLTGRYAQHVNGST